MMAAVDIPAAQSTHRRGDDHVSLLFVNGFCAAAAAFSRRISAISQEQQQKWSNMSNLGRSRRRRWRGVALGGRLQRACRFCLAGHDGQARTSQIAEWCRPEIVYAGGKPTAIQIAKHARSLRSIGAVKVRREGREWVWRLNDTSRQ
jgi:hypothetical protein